MLLGLALTSAAPAAGAWTPTDTTSTTTTTDTTNTAVAASAWSATVHDGGQPRRITRYRRGTAAVPVEVDFEDPATGRRAVALLGDSAIVQLADGRAIDVVAARHGVVVVRPLMTRAGLWLVRSPEGAGEDGVDVAVRLQAAHDGDLREVFPNLAFRHQTQAPAQPFIPDDPRYGAQFFLRELQMEGAWLITQGSADVVVSVIDNGCDEAHPDLADKLDQGHDVITDDDNPAYTPNSPGNEHGTACSGLVAAVTNNDLDTAGACPLCRLTCTRLLPGRSEPVPLDADVRAFDHALQDDVDVVSNSWGFVDAIPVPQVLRAAIIEVQQRGRGGLGAVVVFASGNDSREIADDELLAVPGVVGVGATNNLGELTQFSNRGRSVDVTAPTGTVTTDISGADGNDPGDVTVQFGGTSSAAPLVSGVAGLLLAVDPSLTADEVNAILEETAEQAAFARPDDLGHDLEYGFGLVRADLAVARAAGIDEVDVNGDVDPATGCDCGSGDAGAALLVPGLVLWRRRRLT